MATLAELRTRIINKISDGDITEPTPAQVDEQLNLTIDFFENESFWFLEAVATPTATIGDPILTTGFPTDFKEFVSPNAFNVLDDQIKYPLQHITPLAYDQLDVQGQGLPRWFTFQAGQVKLYYYPDQAYSIQMFYRILVADLVNDGDTNVFTDNAERLIEYKTLSDLLRDYRSDFQRAGVYDQKVEQELQQIKRETYNRTATGNLSTENIAGSRRDNYWGYGF